jgi:hypothetical protein
MEKMAEGRSAGAEASHRSFDVRKILFSRHQAHAAAWANENILQASRKKPILPRPMFARACRGSKKTTSVFRGLVDHVMRTW